MEPEDGGPLRQLPVDFSEIDLIASESEEYLFDEYARTGYLDTQTGQVHILHRDAFRCIEGEVEAEDLSEWAREDLEVAAAIVDDSAGRFQEIERWESSEEYQLMEEFADATENAGLRDQLFAALNGHKPFRRFKDVLLGSPDARKAWFSCRDLAHRDWIRGWLNGLGIDPVDTSSQPNPLPEKW